MYELCNYYMLLNIEIISFYYIFLCCFLIVKFELSSLILQLFWYIELDGREDTKIKIPDRVTIELTAHTNTAWSRVQSLSQNPRLRISIRPERPLSVIFDFVHHKWKSRADQIVCFSSIYTLHKLSDIESLVVNPKCLNNAQQCMVKCRNTIT